MNQVWWSNHFFFRGAPLNMHGLPSGTSNWVSIICSFVGFPVASCALWRGTGGTWRSSALWDWMEPWCSGTSRWGACYLYYRPLPPKPIIKKNAFKSAFCYMHFVSAHRIGQCNDGCINPPLTYPPSFYSCEIWPTERSHYSWLLILSSHLWITEASHSQ